MKPLIPKKTSQWLLPLVLVLFILEVLTFPLVVDVTYAGRSDGPDHTLTYTTGALVWDDAAGIDEFGVARLHLFDAVYGETVDGNGENVVAPGTEGFHILRLKNESESDVAFTAVLYRIRSNESLPVTVSLQGEGFADTQRYTLPYQIAQEDVLRAVSGTLIAGQLCDFDISWLWEYETDEQQNLVDTVLGDAAEPDNITVGVYIVVEDEGQSIPPQTGESSHIGMYLTLMGISLCALVLLWWDRSRERKRSE